jgi:hypothetical protein
MVQIQSPPADPLQQKVGINHEGTNSPPTQLQLTLSAKYFELF